MTPEQKKEALKKLEKRQEKIKQDKEVKKYV